MEPDDLYGLALDAFIPERGALAKALRADKRRDEAAQVAALRKPSVAAWAVNQLVRTQGDAVRELFDAGDGLREAQADLLAGRGDGRTLRAANERERDAVDALVEAARGLLSSEGHELSAAVVERVADTLHAAALDAGAREQVRDGRLERELRHAGLGLGESPGPAPAPKSTPKPAAPAKPATADKPAARKPDPAPSREEAAEARRAAREQAKREKAEREQAERERDEARKAARTAEVAARRRAKRAGHALQAAEERRDRAAHALEQADEALAAAQAEVQEAVDAQAAAQAEFKQLS